MSHAPLTLLGSAYRQYCDAPFGIALRDRLLHLYVIGQTGTGKSTLLYNMAKQDAQHGVGFCLIDPHGDLAAALSAGLDRPHIYWDVADPHSPYGYNPLTRVSAAHRPLIASGLIDTLKKQWADSWGARMEHLLRYAILALLEQPSADLREIVRLYIDKEFRRGVVSAITDPQVRWFWTQEFPNMNYMNAVDGVAPIANKLGAFLAHPVVRKAVCEPEQPLRFRQIMDEGGILIINLAKGRLGTDITNVLGGLIVANLLNAALSRTAIAEADRRPFMLYVDEFHAFTTLAFATLLPESRKYGLGLTAVQQHTIQSQADVRAAVFGNVGSIIAFRVGADDAPILERQFGTVSAADLMTLPNHHAYVQLMNDGHKSTTFSARTWSTDDPHLIQRAI